MTLTRHRRSAIAATVVAVAVTLGGVAVPPAGAATATSRVPAERLVSLQAVALVPGSADPIAQAGASAVQALLVQQATGVDDGTVAGARRTLAELVAARARLAVDELDAVWARTEAPRLLALFAALGQYGVPYRSMQSKPGIGFDCSGLTTYAWSVAGVQLPRSSGSQIVALGRTTLEAALPGDILWYPGHVGMSLGLGKVYLHSPYPGRTVEIVPVRRVSRVGSPAVLPT